MTEHLHRAHGEHFAAYNAHCSGKQNEAALHVLAAIGSVIQHLEAQAGGATVSERENARMGACPKCDDTGREQTSGDRDDRFRGWKCCDCRAGKKLAASLVPAAPQPAHGRPHIVEGEFQSDKYPTCPRGKVPLSVKDPTAQDLLWEYAQRRRAIDAEFGDDLEFALRNAGYVPDMTRCPDCHDGGACLPGGCGVTGCTRCGKPCPTCGGSCEVAAPQPESSGGGEGDEDGARRMRGAWLGLDTPRDEWRSDGVERQRWINAFRFARELGAKAERERNKHEVAAALKEMAKARGKAMDAECARDTDRLLGYEFADGKEGAFKALYDKCKELEGSLHLNKNALRLAKVENAELIAELRKEARRHG